MSLRLLDLFCGEGGSAEGYARAGWDVFGIDIAPARLARYPFPWLRTNALTYLAAHGREYDAIHASPPCTGYTRGTVGVPDRLNRYERLIPAVRDLLRETGRPYVIENVEDARPEMVDPIRLCGTEFGLTALDDDGTPLWLQRHRLFESNATLTGAGGCRHPVGVQCAGSYGGARRDPWEARYIRKGGYVPSADVQRRLLGTPWMSETGCQLSIPPAYTQHIGKQLAEAVP